MISDGKDSLEGEPTWIFTGAQNLLDLLSLHLNIAIQGHYKFSHDGIRVGGCYLAYKASNSSSSASSYLSLSIVTPLA